MIAYSEEWLIRLLFRQEGSVFKRSALHAFPAAVIAVVLVFSDGIVPRDTKAAQLWAASTAVLSLLLGLRTSTALSRFWEGTGLLHQMRGEWFDMVSCCVTFSRGARGTKSREVMQFRHTLIRLMSLCHSSALNEIQGDDVDEQCIFETVDVEGLDCHTLYLLHEFKDRFGFNRVETLVHMMQTLITNAHETGIVTVAPPILSRVYQTLSRGFVNMLNAKKICDTRFPFPFAQLIAFLLILHTVLTPLMVSTVFTSKFFAFVFAFVPVFGMYAVCFIARELENPFGQELNDLPLSEFQLDLNKCLLFLVHDGADHLAGVGPECIMEFEDLVCPLYEVRSSSTLDFETNEIRQEVAFRKQNQHVVMQDASEKERTKRRARSLSADGAQALGEPLMPGIFAKTVKHALRKNSEFSTHVEMEMMDLPPSRRSPATGQKEGSSLAQALAEDAGDLSSSLSAAQGTAVEPASQCLTKELFDLRPGPVLEETAAPRDAFGTGGVAENVTSYQLLKVMEGWSSRLEKQCTEVARSADAMQYLGEIIPRLLHDTVSRMADTLVSSHRFVHPADDA